MKLLNTRTIILFALIVIAAFSRMITFSIPEMANFSPIMALALFTGAFFARKGLAIAAPLAAMFISDLVIGFHDAMPAVYISFALAIFLGYFLLNKKVTVTRVIGGSLAASVLFFIVTNFWVWAAWGYYTHDFNGFIACYELALPFFRNALIGDLIYSGVFFGAFALAGKLIPSFSDFKLETVSDEK